MRNRDKVLDDLRCVQSKDRSSLVKACVASARTEIMKNEKLASRSMPYGAKKVEPIEECEERRQDPLFDSTATCAIRHPARNYVVISSTTGCTCGTNW